MTQFYQACDFSKWILYSYDNSEAQSPYKECHVCDNFPKALVAVKRHMVVDHMILQSTPIFPEDPIDSDRTF